MKRGLSVILFCVIYTIIQEWGLPADSIYAEDEPSLFRIRQMSSKRNEELFKDIAIDLLNGKSRFVSLDTMVRVLKGYKIVEFNFKDTGPAREIILKEIAYRMLRQHYLPCIGDKIRIYKLQRGVMTETGVSLKRSAAFETDIRLPLEIAVVKDKSEVKTLYWSNMVSQISNVIEKLWLRRIENVAIASSDFSGKEVFLEAADILRKKFIQGEGCLKEERIANEIAKAAQGKLEPWLKEGTVSKEDFPALCQMMIQYIILSSLRSANEVRAEIENLKTIGDLKEMLRIRIKYTAEALVSQRPSDYGVFVMLQSLLNDVLERFPAPRNNPAEPAASRGIKESTPSA